MSGCGPMAGHPSLERKPSLLQSLNWCGGGLEPSSPEKLPADDRLQEKIAELAGFDKLLDSLEAFSRDFSEAQERLEATSPALISGLGSAFGDAGPPGSENLLPRLRGQLEGWAERLRLGRSHAEAVTAKVAATRTLLTDTRRALKARSEAFKPKAKADEEAEALTRRFGRSFSVEEKKGRLQAKHKADECFREVSAQAEEAIEQALHLRWRSTAAILAELCSCMSAVLGGGQQSSADFMALSRMFAAQCPGEDGGWMPGQASASATPPRRSRGILANVASYFSPTPPAPDADLRRPPAAAAAAARQGPPPPAAASAREASSSTPPPPPRLAPASSAGSSRPPAPPMAASSASGSTCRDGAAVAAAAAWSEGEMVEVWSSSEARWLEGVVDKIFREAGEDGGYSVPAGVVRVSHAFGVKYIRPDQMASRLRKRGD